MEPNIGPIAAANLTLLGLTAVGTFFCPQSQGSPTTQLEGYGWRHRASQLLGMASSLRMDGGAGPLWLALTQSVLLPCVNTVPIAAARHSFRCPRP